MTDQMDGRQRPDAPGQEGRDGFGDGQGTRVGSPTLGTGEEAGHLAGAHAAGGAAQRPEARGAPQSGGGRSGAGSEAAEGMHAADGDRTASDRTSLEGKDTGRGTTEGAGRSGSEPIDSHDREHRSSYGGGGRPEGV